MSLLFADIYDGIRCLRIQKGVCERDILNYVQEKVGGCMKVGNVLKTIRTIKKLVDDGILVKKGNRYKFSGKNLDEDDDDDDDEEEEEEEEEDDCNQDEDLDMGDDDCDEEEDDEESDNDDDDDEEDDDDDDDDDDDEGDDECDENVEPKTEDGNGSEEKCEENYQQVQSKNQFLEKQPLTNPANQSGDNPGASVPEKSSSKNNCLQKTIGRNLTSKEKKSGKTKDSVMEQDGNKGDEAIAFCVRDFIDSMRQQSKTENSEEGSVTAIEAAIDANNGDEIMDSEKIIENSAALSSKPRKPRNKNLESRRIFRSRSPIKKVKANKFSTMKNDFRKVSSETFQEPVELEMEVDSEKEDTTHLLSTGGALQRQASSCSIEGTSPREIKIEEPENPSTVKSSQIKLSTLNKGDYDLTWYPLEDSKNPQEMRKRSPSSDVDKESEEKHVSLCSICEKKKRTS